MQKEIIKYRGRILPKMIELYNTSIQLKHYWIQIDENSVGSNMEKFIRNGSLGASLFGPIGVAVAAGAAYLNETKKEEKKSSMEKVLFENWEQAYEAFYIMKLKEYHKAYQELSKKISKRFITHYKQAQQIAINRNKGSEFNVYISNELRKLATNKHNITMRNNLLIFDKLFK